MQVGPLFFHRPSMTSTYDSAAESIATFPPESDLNDEQIRTMQASPLYSQEREASTDPITSLSLLKRKLSVKFISLSRRYGETRSEGEHGETRCAVFKQKGSRVKKHFPTET